MRAIVVYESHWGSTAAVARAIAEGMGHDVPALHTDDAYSAALAGVDLIVAGAPGHRLRAAASGGAETARRRCDRAAARRPLAPVAPRVARRPGLQSRLGRCLRDAHLVVATRRDRHDESKLREAGYLKLTKAERFIVGGAYGPLRDGELARARVWGATLAALLIERLAVERDHAAAGRERHAAYPAALGSPSRRR